MPLCIALLAALALFGGACSSPTAPTAITIAPAISVLKVGQGETLRVVAAADAPGALMEGGYTVETRGANVFGVQMLRLEHRLVNVTRR